MFSHPQLSFLWNGQDSKSSPGKAPSFQSLPRRTIFLRKNWVQNMFKMTLVTQRLMMWFKPLAFQLQQRSFCPPSWCRKLADFPLVRGAIPPLRTATCLIPGNPTPPHLKGGKMLGLNKTLAICQWPLSQDFPFS